MYIYVYIIYLNGLFITRFLRAVETYILGLQKSSWFVFSGINMAIWLKYMDQLYPLVI